MYKDVKVSVIVPVYNSEDYVGKSIESLMRQTLKEIEIILVDDGSKDNSGKICDEYAKKDERIVVIHKENGGLADARNAGMKVVKGKYIMFLDADDLFEEDSCEHMYNTIEKNGVDYVIGNYQMMNEDGTRWENSAFDQEKYKDFKLHIHDFKNSFFVMNSTAWNKIYRTQFLIDNNITFEVPAPAEDAYFTSICYMKAVYGFYTSKVIYLYRNSPNSISKVRSEKYFKGINYAYRKIYEAFEENGELGHYRYVYAKINAYITCQLIDSDISKEAKIQCLKDYEWYLGLNEKLKVYPVHDTLKKVMRQIREKDYENAIIEMERLKEYRKNIPDNIKKRMSFPTPEHYAEISKYDDEFKKTINHN